MGSFLSVVVGLLLTGPARADVTIDDATKKATAKALAWLAAKQNADGSWSDGRYLHNTAITSFALLAFLSQGHLPNQGQYGPEVAKGARFLMAAAQPAAIPDRGSPGKRIEGAYLIGARGGNMYCHGMATLALAELWGQAGDDDIRPILKKATDLIINTQNSQGGWRYEPQPTGADISVTIMQVMALRAAKNAGLHVPDVTIDKAIRYIKACYQPEVGGFSYMPGQRGPGFARTAAGCCVLFLTRNAADKQREEEIERMMPKAVAYLKQSFNDQRHFYYGHYYAAHAMHQVGGKDWEDWYARIVKHFVPRQNPDGSWSGGDGTGVGPVYQTSIAVIILSIPAHYLPIFQR